MKIIFDPARLDDNVTSCVASSEDANFPDENLRDDFTTNLWKAASGTTATITLQVTKGSAILIMNTNATAITILTGSGESYVNESGFANESGYAYAADSVTNVPTSDLPGVGGRIWVEYPEILLPHTITISMTAAAVPYAGIVRAGIVQTFRDPAPNNGEGSQDYSIEKELNNGADYYRKRNIVRTFSNLSMIETRANAWLFKHDIFDAVGPQPLGIRIFEGANVDDCEFVVFAKRMSSPQLEHLTKDFTRISFNLREVI